MLYLIYLLLLAMNGMCLLLHRRNRIIQVLTFVFLIILMGGNNFNNDYDGYAAVYNGAYDPHFEGEYGIKFVFSVGNLLGLSYQGMCLLIFTVALCANFSLAKKLNANMHLVLGLYLTFGFISDTVVVRNFIAIAFLTNALLCLSQNKRIRSLIFMILAFLFHKTMIFYIPLLFMDFKQSLSRKIAEVWGVFIVIICFFVFAYGGRFENIAEIILDILYEGQSSVYLVGGVNYGFLIYFFVHIVSIFAVFYARKTLFENIEQKNSAVFALINTAYLVDWYVVLCFPLLMISVAMHRLFRNVMFFNLIAMGVALNSFDNKKITLKYYMFCGVMFVFAFVWRILYFFEMPVEFGQIMNNNVFF